MVGKKHYYAVAVGRVPGVYMTWDECKENVSGYSKARYKKFSTQQDAEEFIEENKPQEPEAEESYSSPTSPTSPPHPPSSSMLSQITQRKRPRLELQSIQNVRFQEIYIDGAARGNGKDPYPQAGYGLFYGPGDPRNSAVPLSEVDDVRQTPPTNQRAELHAMYHALKNIELERVDYGGERTAYRIYTDSSYAKQCVETWAPLWRKNDWKNTQRRSVVNRDIIEPASSLLEELREKGVIVELYHVKGHSGNIGNEQADRLANLGADQMKIRD